MKKMKTTKIVCNGNNIASGKSISIVGGRVFVDGKPIEGQEETENTKIQKYKNVQIIIEGSVEGNLNVDVGDIKIKGDVKGNVNVDTGDIRIDGGAQNINVDTGSVHVGGCAGGSITVDCGNVTVKGK